MTPDQWKRVSSIFDAVAGVPTAHRHKLLPQLCGGDESVREQVERLVRNQIRTDDLFSRASSGVTQQLTECLAPDTPQPEIIDHRYRCMGVIGTGGMGTVYKVQDRLTGHTFALKQINCSVLNLSNTHAPSADRQPEAPSARSTAISITNEFRIAASVRHPNVVAVVDYGFDNSGLPYFTMEAYENAQLITEAIAHESLDQRVRWGIELLRALEYLHRRNILHLDIKPENVLIADRRVKLVDFGIAGVVGSMSPAWCTFPYVAPEVLAGSPPTPRSDLYSAGVVLRRLLDDHSDSTRIDVVTADLLRTIVGRMTHEDPSFRYASAAEALDDLYACVGDAAPPEISDLTSDFPESLPFVGRQQEITLLRNSVQEILDGRGAFWLITGEPGIGKTRLLEELRVQALVRGCRVFLGQTSRTVGYAYHLWRDVIRRAVLSASVREEELATLSTVAPPPADMPQHTAPASTDIRADLNALTMAVQALFRSQNRPCLLLIEDLQWADKESLDLLAALVSHVGTLRCMVVATTRLSRSALPVQFSACSELKLSRLTRDAIEELCGCVGRARRTLDDAVVTSIVRNSEGNPLLISEMLRAVCTAGTAWEPSLDGFRPSGATGVDTLISARLKELTPDAHSVLTTAAIMGRRIDVELLSAIVGLDRADTALLSASTTGIIEYSDGSWSFSHDKFRDSLIASLDAPSLSALHGTIAQTIEERRNPLVEAPKLAYHWREAGDNEREGRYCKLAGAEFLRLGAYQRSAEFLSRALSLIPAIRDTERKAREELAICLDLGAALIAAKGYSADETKAVFDRACELSLRSGDVSQTFHALFGQASYHLFRAQLTASEQLARKCALIAERSGNDELRIQSTFAIGNALYWLGNFPKASESYEAVVDGFEALQKPTGWVYLGHNPRVTCSTFGAWSAWALGRPDTARHRAEQAVTIASNSEHSFSEAIACHVLAITEQHRADPQRTQIAASRLLDIGNQFPIYVVAGQVLLGWALVNLGCTSQGIDELQRGLRLWTQIGASLAGTYFAVVAADAYQQAGMLKDARATIEHTLALLHKTEERSHQAELYRLRGCLELACGRTDSGEVDLLRAVSIARRQRARGFELRSACTLARLWLGSGRIADAESVLKTVYSAFTEGTDTTDVVTAKTLMEELANHEF